MKLSGRTHNTRWAMRFPRMPKRCRLMVVQVEDNIEWPDDDKIKTINGSSSSRYHPSDSCPAVSRRRPSRRSNELFTRERSKKSARGSRSTCGSCHLCGAWLGGLTGGPTSKFRAVIRSRTRRRSSGSSPKTVEHCPTSVCPKAVPNHGRKSRSAMLHILTRCRRISLANSATQRTVWSSTCERGESGYPRSTT